MLLVLGNSSSGYIDRLLNVRAMQGLALERVTLISLYTVCANGHVWRFKGIQPYCCFCTYRTMR